MTRFSRLQGLFANSPFFSLEEPLSEVNPEEV
jgi:hypothetical protein